MKSFKLSALGLCLAYWAMGQNNVGINNNNPFFTIDVAQAGALESRPMLMLRNATTTIGAMSLIQFSNTINSGESAMNWGTYIGGIRINASLHGLVFGTSITTATPPIETMRLVGTSGGRLGIGTANPLAGLHISGTTNSVLIRMEDASGNPVMNLNSIGRLGIGTANPLAGLHISGTTNSVLIRMEDAGGNPVMNLNANGRLGLGTNSPVGPLHITGNNAATLLRIDDQDGNRRIDMYPSGNIRFFQGTGGGTEVMALICNINNTPTSRLVVDQVQVKGGSDVAEYFNITSTIQAQPMPGTVVVFSNNEPGKLEVSQTAYNNKVVGVISGANGLNPGIMMSQHGSQAHGDYPIAIGGRVYVKAEATQQAIKIGDLVTTSNIPGYAMKATNKKRMQGAILGKAMNSLARGETGLIMILVSLQ